MTTDDMGQVNSNNDNPMNQVSLTLENLTITSIDFLNIPSPHMTLEHMTALAQKIKDSAHHFDAVVITHGTDTLEETAYFLDTLELADIPIVLTGAMRSSNELGSDGVYNYLSALKVASHPKANGKGVLVVMNDEIHAAKYVTKTHTTNVSTFQTPTHGPLGIILKDDILFFQAAEKRLRFALTKITGTVPIIKAYAGMGASLIELIQPETIDGLVVEAFGAGNLPPDAAKALITLHHKGVPVVLVSRCFNGIAEPVYAYDGGGSDLANQGILFVKELNSQKARLKLLIALSAGLNGKELKDYIEG